MKGMEGWIPSKHRLTFVVPVYNIYKFNILYLLYMFLTSCVGSYWHVCAVWPAEVQLEVSGWEWVLLTVEMKI